MTAHDKVVGEEHDLLESVFNAIQDGIIFLDQHLTFVRVNRWMEKKFASKMPLIGKKCYELFKERKDPCSDCPFRQALKTEMSYTQVLPYPPEQTPKEWFEVSVFRLKDKNYKVIGAVAHIKEITERKQAEDLLKDEIMQRRLLVEQSRDGIVVLDQNGKVYEANRRYADMLGYSMEEVYQLHVWDWDTQWTKAELLKKIHEVDDTGDHFETYHRRKDGSIYNVEISSNGTIYRGMKLIFCVCRDITERKQAEKEREDLIDKLQEALKEIKTLQGLLPICSFCKKIRDENDAWQDADVYIRKHSEAGITHSICPECLQKHYPEMK
jgi:PAS domain S-box-containing protein